MQSTPLFSLLDVAQDVYLRVACFLEEQTLCSLDSSCRSLRASNSSPGGRWRTIGLESFRGVELHQHGGFGSIPASPSRGQQCRPSFWRSFHCFARRLLPKSFAFDLIKKVKLGFRVAKPLRDTEPLREEQPVNVDWKTRYCLFARLIPTFREPFQGREITGLVAPHEIGYCQCNVPCVQPPAYIDVGVYVEFAIRTDCYFDTPNFSLVDSAGGHSGVTFRPDTGTVVRKCMSQETPPKLKATYIQPLTDISCGDRPFVGSVGIYVKAGHVAFFRRRGNQQKDKLQLWETTGYSTDLNWAEHRYMTPAVVFRDEGVYRVSIVHVGHTPPRQLGTVPSSYDESRWKTCKLKIRRCR